MNRNLLLVAISLFAWGVGEGLFIYFQPLYLQQLGADPLLTGAVFGAMGIAMAVSQIPAGYLSDRIGARSLMWASWLLGAISAWVMALANSLPVFIVGLILYGLTGSVMAPMNSYITTVRGKYSIGKALTFASGLYNIGAIIGPISGGLIADLLGLRSVYMLAAVLFVISTVIVLFIEKNPATHHADEHSTNGAGLLKNTRFIMFLGITLLTIFAIYLPQPFTPSFLQNQQSLSLSTIGIFGAIGSLGNAVAMLTLGNLRAFTAFIIGQAWVLLFSIIYFTADLPAWFGLGYFFIGGYRLCRAMVLAIAREFIHPRQTGLAYGMVETMNAVAVIIAPALAGYLYSQDPYSIYRVSLVLISLVLVMNLVIYYQIKRRNRNVSEIAPAN
jgi:MFS family permease